MNNKKILPELDLKTLQVAANEAAMKGAIEIIDKHYNGWDSPFKKQIEKELTSGKVKLGIELPDIIGLINNSLSDEIDRIANAAIAKSYIPLVRNLLTVEKPQIKFSDFLKKFIQCVDAEYLDDCIIEVTEVEDYDWLDIKIESSSRNYKITFHVFNWSDMREGKPATYQVLNLPFKNEYSKTMTLKIENGSLEIPFQYDILNDNFMSYLAKLILAKTEIVMDTRYFDEDMFPKECHCS